MLLLFEMREKKVLVLFEANPAFESGSNLVIDMADGLQ
jgi:hypothetical protein